MQDKLLNSAAEITVKVSNNETSLVQKFLSYDGLSLSHDDPSLKKMVHDTVEAFKGDVEDVVIKIKMVW